ncbi:MAG: NUDIX domain-containing protein [Candidatus Omnitrophica bacterium]|nr:NUDIX domain-containing protein [Candidatus Omnitrophota bacterium]
MELKKIIDILESSVQNPSKGLPEELFLFVTRITPIINVDLLIKEDQNNTLLTWRDDGYYPPGWHIPGGIIRYKETIAERVKAVAKNELGVEVEFIKTPLAVNEVIHNVRKNRGHFISMLYQCSLVTQPDESLRCKGNSPNPDEWMWHDSCPANIISVHEMYRKFI